MARKIAISTNKGGVLKTSITTNLAGVLAKKKEKVLIIDTDNQGNTSLTFGRNPDQFTNTLYDVLVDGLNPKYAIVNVYKNIDILPSNRDMSFFELDVLTQLDKYKDIFYLLHHTIQKIEHNYDYILIDTPPNLGLVQGNVLTAVDEVLIPFQPENYSMRSVIDILDSIKRFKKENNPSLKVIGIVATLVDLRTTLHTEILEECRKFCYQNDLPMLDVIIPKTIRYATSVAYNRLPATLVEKKTELVKAYYDLEREIC